ncbi:hypothetical protein R6Q57_013918 [Mikania cordata]
MASFSPSPNSPPVSDPTSPPPPSTTVPPPASPPPPATAPPPSTPPVSSPPPTNSPPPSSPIPPTSSPPQASPPSTSSPPPLPPQATPPPPFPPPPPSNPPASSPPPPVPPPPSTVPPRNSPSIPPPPSISPPPPSISPPPPAVPPRNSPSVPPPPILSPPTPSVPPRNSPSVPPRNSPSVPPPLILSPPPPSIPPSNSPSIPPPPILRPPPPTSTNSSSPPVITASPPPLIRPPPSPSEVLIPPPVNQNNNDSSPNRPSSNGGIGTGGIVGITAVLGIVLLTTIITILWCLIKRKKKIARHNGLYDLPTSMYNSPQSDSGLLKIRSSAVEIGNLSANEFSPQEPGGLGNSISKFTYEDLIEATNGFSPQNLLGSGGFGYVYKGILIDGTEVAVKELKIGSGQGEREFSAEVEIISRIHHRHLVSLVGYCISENKRLLVYEYVPNNTLYYHLHVSHQALDWPTRVRVASGAGRGIAYLHEDCHPRVIHRDIKSSNILLDKNFEARVSDFGLAKLAADIYTHVTTRVMGTFGYMAPEYASSGKLTEKSDVFSFGVILLELITGRKPVDASQPLGDESLVEWARPLLSHALETEDFKHLVDPKLSMNFVPNEMFLMIEAAAACVRHSATKRPRMGQIVRAFENLDTKDLSNGMRVGESEIYNSSELSAEIRLFQRMAFGSQNYSTDYFTQDSWVPNSKERFCIEFPEQDGV